MDIRRIVGFEIKPWVESFLQLRVALGDLFEHNEVNEESEPLYTVVRPEGFHILQVALHGRLVVAMSRTLQRLSDLYFSKPFPHIIARSERDTAIRTLYQQGIDLHQLAAMFSLSYSRAYQIAYGRKKSNKRSSAAE